MVVIKKQRLKVVGVMVITSYDYLYLELLHTLDRFFEHYNEISNRIDTKIMNIIIKKDSNVFTQLVCVEVNEFENIPEGMTAFDFPESEYLLFNHRGKLSAIPDSFVKMDRWANENGFSTDSIKIDYGYYQQETEIIEHTLLVKIL